MQTITTALASVCLAIALAGCGQKGPLYRPGHAPASQTNTPFDNTSDTESQDKADSGAEPGDRPNDAG